jgi:hypothetical protein
VEGIAHALESIAADRKRTISSTILLQRLKSALHRVDYFVR